MCFEYLEIIGGVVELPPHMCLPTRPIVESSIDYCHLDKRICPEHTHCIRPLLSNSTVLLTIKRRNSGDVIYIGHPSDLFLTVSVSSFVPKYNFLKLNYAAIAYKLLKYLVVFSSGLAILNVLPCFFFDGQHIIGCLSKILLRKRNHRNKFTFFIVLFGTILLLINLIFTIVTIVFRN